MAGLSRFVAVLRLFGEQKSEWTVQDMAEALGLPASTVYRTVRELVRERFLEPAAEAHYRLGAAFVAFDRLVRLTDPLARASATRLHDLAARAGMPCVALLARLYGDTVMCVAGAANGYLPHASSYHRGRLMPLSAGATSKVILAQLPPRRLGRLVVPTGDQAPPMAPLKQALAAIRKRGYYVSRGEIDPALAGLAVPVTLPELGITAGISLVVEATRLTGPDEDRLIPLLQAAARGLDADLRGDAIGSPP